MPHQVEQIVLEHSSLPGGHYGKEAEPYRHHELLEELIELSIIALKLLMEHGQLSLLGLISHTQDSDTRVRAVSHLVLSKVHDLGDEVALL